MKKLLLTLVLILLTFMVSFEAPIKRWIYPEKAISKNIRIEIASSSSYQNSVYAHCSAQLNVTVVKLKGNKMDTLLVKAYPEVPLRHLSAFCRTFKDVVHISNVRDSQEQILLLYKVDYKSKEGILSIPSVYWVPKGGAENKIQVNI